MGLEKQIELRRCPFCGASSRSVTLMESNLYGVPYPQKGDLYISYNSYGWVFVRCNNCHCTGPTSKAPRGSLSDNEKLRIAFLKAAIAWNEREL